MFLVATRNFPPELGGMQNLMEGLSNALLNHGPVKVFAENTDNAETYDQNSKLNIDRVSGFKMFRKYRKANLIKEFAELNELRAMFFDHWKSIENIDGGAFHHGCYKRGQRSRIRILRNGCYHCRYNHCRIELCYFFSNQS